MKRFYSDVGIVAAEGGFRVTLDAKPLRTPAKALLAVPSRRLADAIAAEWRGQGGDVKLGQVLSTRADLVPPDLVRELAHCRAVRLLVLVETEIHQSSSSGAALEVAGSGRGRGG